jgi:hypothetical protein
VIERMESSLFDWSTWRGGCVTDIIGLDLRCRTADLASEKGKARIMRYAVGWCPAERVPCRPKANHAAVMFFRDGRHFWFHLRSLELRRVLEAGDAPRF